MGFVRLLVRNLRLLKMVRVQKRLNSIMFQKKISQVKHRTWVNPNKGFSRQCIINTSPICTRSIICRPRSKAS
jgi:hypothetical protein